MNRAPVPFLYQLVVEGYEDEADNTWEPADHLHPKLVAEFEAAARRAALEPPKGKGKAAASKVEAEAEEEEEAAPAAPAVPAVPAAGTG